MKWRFLATTIALMGCSFGAEDVDKWKTVQQGDQRLAGYLVDSERPLELRVRAMTNLFQMGQLGQIVAALDALDDGDRKQVSSALGENLVKTLKGDHDTKDHARAAELSYYLLERADALEADTAQALTESLVSRALEWFGREDAPKTRQPAPELIRAALLVRPQVAKGPVLEHLRVVADVNKFTALVETLRQMHDRALDGEVAALLLDFAKRRYPEVDPVLADAMVKNGNETLLFFLLDSVQDPRVPTDTRNTAMEAAHKILGHKALDGLMKLLSLDEPNFKNLWRLNALDLIVILGGVDRLADALRELPPGGTWPREDGQFKAQIDQFCESEIAPRFKDGARATFVELLADPNPIARAYALGCVLQLYPAEAPDLLAPMIEDETVLDGWLQDGPTTFGEVARGVVEG